MDVERVVEATKGIPHMRPRRILELGFAHGVSTCYLAAAAEEVNGHVTTMDRRSALDHEPNIETLTERLGLTDYVTPVLAERSFTWNLMQILRDAPDTRYDFVFLDGGHTWDVTGFCFFLVDRLLEPGGWLLFDDLGWTYQTSPSLASEAAKLPSEEASTPQVGLVFDLLVESDTRYDTWKDGEWGWARKEGDQDGPG